LQKKRQRFSQYHTARLWLAPHIIVTRWTFVATRAAEAELGVLRGVGAQNKI